MKECLCFLETALLHLTASQKKTNIKVGPRYVLQIILYNDPVVNKQIPQFLSLSLIPLEICILCIFHSFFLSK